MDTTYTQTYETDVAVAGRRSGTGISGAIASGSLIVLALLLFFALVGSSAGLSNLQLERGEVPAAGSAWVAGIGAILALALSFFAGGYASSLLSRTRDLTVAGWQGLGVWAAVVVLSMWMVGAAATNLGGLIRFAGITAGTALTGDSMLEQISRVRFVTDMKMLDSKAVSYLVVSPSEQSPLESAVRDAKKELAGPEGEQLRQTAGAARQNAAATGWVAVIGLFLSAAASVGGSLVARKHRGDLLA